MIPQKSQDPFGSKTEKQGVSETKNWFNMGINSKNNLWHTQTRTPSYLHNPKNIKTPRETLKKMTFFSYS